MNFLQMSQKVRELSGIQGTGPVSVDTTNNDSIFPELINNTWRDIQKSKIDWKWMRSTQSFNTALDQKTYSPTQVFGPVNRFSRYYFDSFTYVKDGLNKILRYVDYETFRLRFLNEPTNTPLFYFTYKADANRNLIFTRPDDAYTVTCDYQKNAQNLVNNADIPELPEEYHMVIVYNALMTYAVTMSMQGLQQEYAAIATKAYDNLVREQIPARVFRVRGIA